MTYSYDELPYSKYPHPRTHPERLATVAVLHGLSAPDPAGCRVLELGCGAGGNLIPLAYEDRSRRCVGVDRSAMAIADGRGLASTLGLDNVELHDRDLRDIGAGELGEFDFIVAHGVYTWVPDDVREALLEVLESHLSAEGIAFVSYNAQPGGAFRRMLAAMGNWHARYAPTLPARAEAARELFGFLLEHRAETDDAYGAVLARELPRIASSEDAALIHDELSEAGEAIWFHELVAAADRHRLEWVGEADLAELRADRFPEGMEAALREFSSPGRVAFEQYADILSGRRIRQSLLCRAGRGPAAGPDAQAMKRLAFAAAAAAVAKAGGDGIGEKTLDHLVTTRPRSATFDDLHAQLDADELELSEALLELVRAGQVVPRIRVLEHAREAGEHPRASELARLQARLGADVTSLRHETVHLDVPPQRRLLALLDGTRTRAQLEPLLEGAMGAEELEACLQRFAALALLHE